MSQYYLNPMPNSYSTLESLMGAKPCSWNSVNNIFVNATYNRSPSTCNSIRWNKNGSRLLTGGKDSIVRLYDPDQSSKDLKPISEFRGHIASINHVSFDNPESEFQFSSCSQDRSFRIWDTRKPKQPVHVERTKEEIIRGIYAPAGQGSNLFVTSNFLEEINFYDTRMWKMVKQIKYKTEVNSFMWDLSGAAFFVADMVGNISVYDGMGLKP